ncbi:MAG: YlxR family protein [Acidaminococcus sp.]|nr:YlxR family protein [Acidaminococcus sp.]
MTRAKNVRMCVCCRDRLEKSELIKVSKVGDKYEINYKGNSDGKSVYVCKSCLPKVIDKHLLNRAFKKDLDGDIYSTLKEYE